MILRINRTLLAALVLVFYFFEQKVMLIGDPVPGRQLIFFRGFFLRAVEKWGTKRNRIMEYFMKSK
jgi:hypothetical protein